MELKPHLLLSLICSFFLFGAALGGGERPFLVSGVFLLGVIVFISAVMIAKRCSVWNSFWYFGFINICGLLWVSDKVAWLYFFTASLVFTLSVAVVIKFRNMTLSRECKV